MKISRLLYVLRAIGFDGIFRTLSNSLYRDFIEISYPQNKIPSVLFSLGDIKSVEPIENGATFNYDNASVEILSIARKIIRVTWIPGELPISCTVNSRDSTIVNPQVFQTKLGYSLSWENIVVEIGNTGSITYKNSNLETLKIDDAPTHLDQSWTQNTQLRTDERIYGLGERAAPLNLRPGKYISWNKDIGGSYSTGKDPLYIGTPVYLSMSNVGTHLVYFENQYKSQFTIGEKLSATFEGGALRFYVIFGSLETIYSNFAELVGFSPLPPRWSLGYHQCRWGYRSEDDIKEVVKGFSEHNLPISAIHLDIDYMDGYRVFSINNRRFSDMKKLSDDLEKQGIKIVATINPAIKKDKKYPVYKDGLSKDIFCKLPNGKLLGGVSWPGWSVFPDFANERTREWWSKQFAGLIEAGISGYWLDMNEPSSFAAWGDITLPSATQHNLDGSLIDHRGFHNLYGLMEAKASFDGISKYNPAKRPWIFSRSGWVGLQKYAWNWTGDIETSWQSLKQTIPTILNLSLSGHAYSGVDIGGFTSDPDEQLYIRWFQLATFLPLFRTHSAIGTKRREPWVYSEEATRIIRNYLELRYKLLPYLYTLTWETSHSGIPPLRPIFWGESHDPTFWEIDDEFMLGYALLIAPVITDGAQSRTVNLPSGLWYSFWDDECYKGPIKIDRIVDIQNIPIFIKSGTILPLEENNRLYLHIYPGETNGFSSHIYQDAGDGYGEYRIDTYHAEIVNKSIVISHTSDGTYPFPYQSIEVVLHSKVIDHAYVDGIELTVHSNSIITKQFDIIDFRFQ